MSTETLEQQVLSAMPAMLENMKRVVLERISNECTTRALEEARKATTEWVTAEIIPELRAQLEAGKPALIAKAAEIADQLGDILAKQLAEQAAKSLSSTHVVSDIVQKMFRGY